MNKAEIIKDLLDVLSGLTDDVYIHEKIDILSVMDDGMNLEHVSNKTTNVCLAAVNQNEMAIKFVRDINILMMSWYF